MLPDRVSNPGPLTYESGALPIALRGPALSPNRNTSIIYIVFDNGKSRKEKSSETDSIKFKISSKTPRGKKGQHKKTSP